MKIQTNRLEIIVSCRFIKCCIITLIQEMYVIDGQSINTFVKPELEDILSHHIQHRMYITKPYIIHHQMH